MCARLKNGGPHNNRQLLQHIMRFLWWRQLMNVSNVTNKHTRWKENKRKINVNPVQTLLFPSGLNESCLPSTSHSAPQGLQRSVERSQKTQCSRDCTTSVYLKCEFYLFTFAHPNLRVKYYLFYLNFPSFEVFLQFWFEISFHLNIHFLIQYVLFYIIEVHALLLSFLLS